MSDPLSFLDESSDTVTGAETPAAEPVATPAAEAAPPPPEASAAAEATPAADPAPEAPVVAAVEPAAAAEPAPAPVAQPEAPIVPAGHVPIASMLDERERRRQAEAQLAELRGTQAQPEAPDPNVDWDAYLEHQEARQQQAILEVRLDLSEAAARRVHDTATVDAARDAALIAFRNNPALARQLTSQPDPYEAIVQWHKRETALSKLNGVDLDALLALHAAQAAGAPAAPAAPAPQTPAPASVAAAPPIAPIAPPPPSLVSAPSAGGAAATPQGDGVAFDRVFGP